MGLDVLVPKTIQIMPLPDGFSTDSTTASIGAGDISQQDPNTTGYAVATIINQNHTAAGPVYPPKQQGQYTVPIPSGVQILNTMYSGLGNIFTIAWIDIADQTNTHVTKYEVYAQLALDNNQQPTLVGSSAASPCVCRVIATRAGNVTFWVKPVLNNGQSLPLSACPTVSGSVPNPFFLFDFGTFDSGNTSVLISDNIQFAGTSGQTGIEVYFDSTGITGVHTSIGPGVEEFDNAGGVGPGYLFLSSVLSTIEGSYSNSDGGGYQLALNPTPTSGTYYAELQLGHSITGTGPASLATLSAKTATLELIDGTATHDVVYGCVPVAAPAGAITGGLQIKVNGTNKVIALY